jgi:YVTN family beta-propeller protein
VSSSRSSNPVLGRWRVGIIAALVAGALSLSVGAFALGAGLIQNNTISACVNKTSRVLTVPTAGQSCPSGTTGLSWNQHTEIAGKHIGSFTPVGGDNLTFSNGVWTQSSPINPLKLAELKWYNADRVAVAQVGNRPYGMAFDGQNMWVANSGDDTVDELNAASLGIVHTYHVGVGPNGLAFDGHSIWVANNKDDTVTEINPATQTESGPFSVGHLPIDIAFDGSNLWVTDWGSDQVTELSDSGTVLNTVDVGVEPVAIAYGDSAIWVADSGSGGLTEIDPATAQVIRTIVVDANPGAVAFDGTNVWTCDFDDEQVFVTDASSGELVKDITMSHSCDALVFDGTSMWDAGISGAITRINALSMKPGPDLETFTNVKALAFDGARVWESSSTSTSVELF